MLIDAFEQEELFFRGGHHHMTFRLLLLLKGDLAVAQPRGRPNKVRQNQIHAWMPFDLVITPRNVL